MTDPDHILEKANELGIKYEKECTGCAQTVIAAIFEALGIWSEDVFKAASGLANGLGLSGDGSCAALLGASMVIGYIFGRERKDFGEIYKPMKSYGLVKKLHNLFTKEYGAISCYDVQRNISKVTWNVIEINSMDEYFKDQMIDICSKIVGNVARLATKLILEGGFVPVKQEKKNNA